MKLDFKEIKQVRIVDVLPRYLVKLRYRVGSEYAAAPCPLPTHPAGDKTLNFNIHLPTNRWQCKNTSCGARNGVGDKWGDVINLVALLEGLSGTRAQYEAGVKLVEWFGLDGNKNTAPHMEARAAQEKKRPSFTHIPDTNKGSDSVKRDGHMHNLGIWFDEMVIPRQDETEEEYWKRIKKGFLDKILESYRNGKIARAS